MKPGGAELEKGAQKARQQTQGGCYNNTLRVKADKPTSLPPSLPGLSLVQTLLCDGHNLLEDVTDVLLRLTQIVEFPHVVGITQILPRESNVTQHHVAVVLHRSDVTGRLLLRVFSTYQIENPPPSPEKQGNMQVFQLTGALPEPPACPGPDAGREGRKGAILLL